MSKHAPTYAKLAHAIVHIPGLFRSLAPGERRTAKLDVSHQLSCLSGASALNPSTLSTYESCKA